MYVGGAVWFLPVAALLVALLRRRWSDALFVFLASSTSVLVGDALKLLVARPRPPAELVRVSDLQESYGFPSGTALLSVALLGTVGYLILRTRSSRPVVFVTLGVSLPLILANGLSRVYVGEHWATDVLGGWIFGVAWLIAMVAVHRGWLYRRAKSRESRQIESANTGRTHDVF